MLFYRLKTWNKLKINLFFLHTGTYKVFNYFYFEIEPESDSIPERRNQNLTCSATLLHRLTITTGCAAERAIPAFRPQFKNTLGSDLIYLHAV